MNIILSSLYYEKNRVTGANKRFDFFGKNLQSRENINLTVLVREGETPDWAENIITLPRYDSMPSVIRRLVYCIKLTYIFYKHEGVIINDFMPVPLVFSKRNYYCQLVHDIRNFTDFNRAAVKKISSLFQKIQWRIVPNILTVSSFTKNQLIKYCNVNPYKIAVSYNGIDPVKRKKVKKDIDFLYIATFEKRKNHDNLIIAFSNYVKKYEQHATLFLIGRDLGYRKHIEALISKYQIGEFVTIIEKLSESELNILYERTYCFVNPSLYEGFGMPLIEAMYFDCHVICSDIDVFHEIAKEHAYYFDPLDHESILNAMKEIKNTEIKDGCKTSYAIKNFSWSAIADNFINLLVK
ncbi:glycosyltransferase family 4 protein [Enterobacter hormaechei]|uniref:glycosyltransferase family 4 protein n=1 Tax=Enterobacter hormaechei TaxID=158836 RepID=UPI0038904F4C